MKRHFLLVANNESPQLASELSFWNTVLLRPKRWGIEPKQELNYTNLQNQNLAKLNCTTNQL